MREVNSGAAGASWPTSIDSKNRGDSTISSRTSSTTPSRMFTTMLPCPSTRATCSIVTVRSAPSGWSCIAGQLSSKILGNGRRVEKVHAPADRLRVETLFPQQGSHERNVRVRRKAPAAVATGAVRRADGPASSANNRSHARAALVEEADVFAKLALEADGSGRIGRFPAHGESIEVTDQFILVDRTAVQCEVDRDDGRNGPDVRRVDPGRVRAVHALLRRLVALPVLDRVHAAKVRARAERHHPPASHPDRPHRRLVVRGGNRSLHERHVRVRVQLASLVGTRLPEPDDLDLLEDIQQPVLTFEKRELAPLTTREAEKRAPKLVHETAPGRAASRSYRKTGPSRQTYTSLIWQ